MRYSTALFLSSVIILVGCKIEQTFVFNEDFSGEMTQSIDYSGSKELMEMDSTAGQNGEISLLPDSVIQEINAEMKDIDGAHLVSMSDEDYKLNMKMAFDHIEALNEALQTEPGDTSDVNVHCHFRKDKKSFWVDFVVDDPSKDAVAENQKNEGLEMNMDGLYEMITYRFEFRFAQKIKSVSGTLAVVQDDDHSIVLEQSLQQIVSPDFERSLEIRLK